MRLLHKFRENQAWKRENTLSWEGMDTPNSEGLTQFQNDCLSELLKATGPFETSIRPLGGENEAYLFGKLPKSGYAVFIYEDGAEISNGSDVYVFERWDHRTKNVLLGSFIKTVGEIEI